MPSQSFTGLKSIFKMAICVPISMIIAIAAGLMLFGRVLYLLTIYPFLKKEPMRDYQSVNSNNRHELFSNASNGIRSNVVVSEKSDTKVA